MKSNKRKRTPIKDKPVPKREDVDISIQMEDYFGFRPFGMEW